MLLRTLKAKVDVISILLKALALFIRNLKASFPDNIAKYISSEIRTNGVWHFYITIIWTDSIRMYKIAFVAVILSNKKLMKPYLYASAFEMRNENAEKG
jgi:hypothetical protein